MCDVDKQGAEEMNHKEKVRQGSMCMKCKQVKAVIVVRVHDPLCRVCFLTYFTHKFRATLGKSKVVRANDKVLIAFSGGHSSTALLYLVKEGLSVGAHKRLRFSPSIIFVDESCAISATKESLKGVDTIENVTNLFDYHFFKLPIYKGFCDDDDGSMKNKEMFLKSLNGISTLTSKIRFINNIRLSVIQKFAKENGFTKVMVGENATNLSIKLMCSVAEGNGDAVPQLISVADNSHQNVTVVRPLRELSSKEVVIYNRFNDVSAFTLPNFYTKQSPTSCIQRQTEEFITNLQNGFPSTVYTVFRTGDKLCANEGSDIPRCSLCQRPNSGSKVPTYLDSSEIQQHGESSDSLGLTLDDVKSSLCYGCLITLKEMGNDYSLLPNNVLHSIISNRKTMRDQIQEFLL